MIKNILLIGFQGGIDTVFSSVWTYLILAFFFTLLLIAMLVYVLRSTGISRPKCLPTNGSGDRVYEDQLMQSIETLSHRSKTVLLAAAGLECMPVTIPIRIAMGSSEKNNRCLLIDLDTKRDAVWRAFGLDENNVASSSYPVPSKVKNLAILPAHYFAQSKCMNIRAITENARKQYDLILINAPFLDGHPDRKMITASSQYAFVFAKEPSQVDRLKKLCRTERCKIIGCFKIQKSSDVPNASHQAVSQPLRP